MFRKFLKPLSTSALPSCRPVVISAVLASLPACLYCYCSMVIEMRQVPAPRSWCQCWWRTVRRPTFCVMWPCVTTHAETWQAGSGIAWSSRCRRPSTRMKSPSTTPAACLVWRWALTASATASPPPSLPPPSAPNLSVRQVAADTVVPPPFLSQFRQGCHPLHRCLCRRHQAQTEGQGLEWKVPTQWQALCHSPPRTLLLDCPPPVLTENRAPRRKV